MGFLFEVREALEDRDRTELAASFRERLRKLLEEMGYCVDEGWNLTPLKPLREIMEEQAAFLNPKPDPMALAYIARPEEIDPDRIYPELELVADERASRIFRTALSFWRVPVSPGYGRRMRYLVWDRGNGKLLGVFALSDPVVGLRVRDNHIKWDKNQRSERLWHMMTAYVLGAVPPYNRVLGAKLVASLAATEEVRRDFRERYEGRASLMRGKIRPAELVAIDTMGAFGKTPIYNRLKGWRFLGYTKGQSQHHIERAFPLFREILETFGRGEVLRRYKWGDGPSWRLRVLRTALGLIEVPAERVMSLGLRRAYYVRPMGEGWREFLRGEADDFTANVPSVEEAFLYWHRTWYAPRREALKAKLRR